MSQNGATDMKEAESKFVNRPTRTGKKVYDKFFIYIPTELARDSAFPFKVNEPILIRVKGEKLIIEKKRKS